MSKSKNFITKKCIKCEIDFKIYLYENKKVREKRKMCCSCSRRRPNSGQFKKVGTLKHTRKYANAHVFIKKHKGVPKICSMCGSTNEKMKYEWANVDHKYNKNINDFIRMCSKCHWKYDVEKGLRGKRKDGTTVTRK